MMYLQKLTLLVAASLGWLAVGAQAMRIDCESGNGSDDTEPEDALIYQAARNRNIDALRNLLLQNDHLHDENSWRHAVRGIIIHVYLQHPFDSSPWTMVACHFVDDLVRPAPDEFLKEFRAAVWRELLEREASGRITNIWREVFEQMRSAIGRLQAFRENAGRLNGVQSNEGADVPQQLSQLHLR